MIHLAEVPAPWSDGWTSAYIPEACVTCRSLNHFSLICGITGRSMEEFTLQNKLSECDLFTSFKRIDKDHNVWQCRSCGMLADFEADGPFENGWNCCPHCSKPLEPIKGGEHWRE